MRKRDNIDYRKVSAQFNAWESASLSEEGTQELDEAVSIFESDPAIREEFLSRYPEYREVLNLYIELNEVMRGAVVNCVPDADYDSLAADADEFINGLAAMEKKRNRRKMWRIAISGAVAAAYAAIAVMTAWMNVNSRESQEIQPNIGLASVAQSDTIVEASQGLYAHQEATVEEGQNAAPGANDRMASVGKHDAKKQTSRSDVPTWRDDASVQDGMDAEEATAWRMFMAARQEMAEVLKPDMAGVVWNDVPDLTGQNVTNNDINLPVGIYESLETAGEMFNSIYSGQ